MRIPVLAALLAGSAAVAGWATYGPEPIPVGNSSVWIV